MGLKGPWYRAVKDSWYVWHGGRQVSLRVRGRRNRKAAWAAWLRLRAGVAVAVAPVAGVTVAGLIKRYLDDAAGRVKPKTLAWLRGFLDPFTSAHGALAAADLTPTLVEAYSRKPGWSPSTRHDVLGVLVSVCRWAVRGRLLTANPLADVRRPPKESRGESAVVGPDQFARLLAAAAPSFRPFLEVLYLSGARPGEVAAISSDNFDPTAGRVALVEHKTRHVTGRGRVILLPPRAVAVLEAERQRFPSGPILRNRCGRPWNQWAVTQAVRYARLRAGLPRAVAYGMRHSFVTDSLAAGLSDSMVAELVGHSSTKMLRNYAHLGGRADVLRSALATVRQ